MPDDQPLIRTAEAARALGVSSETLRRWSRAGRVKPARRTLGGQDRWDLEDLKRQVDALADEHG
ncbi:MerR family DNA-binding transcriptional regulator [Pseudonocardia sp. RS010]|uniref:MerR family DNA-binding transcriptional regulator n=1 Tax=Pseudonocardia sp. RS010 TaxID=3385979 RepID=UPI0039A00522